MAANNSIVADAVLEDKLADLWPDYPCLYDVRCPEFKNRELRNKAFQELAEKHGKDACAQLIALVCAGLQASKKIVDFA